MLLPHCLLHYTLEKALQSSSCIPFSHPQAEGLRKHRNISLMSVRQSKSSGTFFDILTGERRTIRHV